MIEYHIEIVNLIVVNFKNKRPYSYSYWYVVVSVNSKLCIPPSKNKSVKDSLGDSEKDTKADGEATTKNNKDIVECSDKSASDKKVNDKVSSELNHEKSAENGHIDSGDDGNKGLDSATKVDCDTSAKDKVKNSEANNDSNADADVSDKVEKLSITSEKDQSNAKDEDGEGSKALEKVSEKNEESRAHMDQDTLTEDELVELHLKADILHYLLPGLCHLTAEEVPRKLLMESGALGVLDLYMWRQWEKLGDETRRTRETMVTSL